MTPITLFPLLDLPDVQPGDDLVAHLLDAATRGGIGWLDGDVLVVAQ